MSASEKERVYAELDALRKRSFNQRREIRQLRTAMARHENIALRREAASYRSALSQIHHYLETGELDEDRLRLILRNALGLRYLKYWQRKTAERARTAIMSNDGRDGEGER